MAVRFACTQHALRDLHSLNAMQVKELFEYLMIQDRLIRSSVIENQKFPKSRSDVISLFCPNLVIVETHLDDVTVLRLYRGAYMESDLDHPDFDAVKSERDEFARQLAAVETVMDQHVPFDVVRRLSEGDSPVAVWREHRSQSRESLAMAAHTSVELLAEIENGKEDVPLRIMNAIAHALRVDLDDLLPWSHEDMANT